MMYRASACFLSFFLLVISPNILDVHSARAEGVGEIINLFGRAIQNDIQRKQQQRQQQEYERQLEAERQVQINADREYQISQIKRTQTALKRLGYYNKRIDGDAGPGTQRAINAYVRAFGLSSFQLEDYDISQLERHAASGFKSNSERQAAQRGGFNNARDLRDAKAAGFLTAREWQEAELAGFDNNKDYQAFLKSGFESKYDFQTARLSGFDNKREMKAALDAGFGDKDSYANFLVSGHPDKASFDAAKRTEARIKSAKAQCETDVGLEKWVDAVASCQSAASLVPADDNIRALNSQALQGSIALVEQLETEKAVIETNLSALEASVSQDETDAQKLARELKAKELRSQLATREAKLETMLASKKGQACEDAAREENWSDALTLCAEADQLKPNARWAELRDNASEAIAVNEKRLAAEKERQAKIAAEEAQRLALEKASETGNTVIADIEAFSNEGGAFQNGLGIVQGLIGLRGVVDGDDAPIIERKAAELSDLLKGEANFQSFLEKRASAAAVATANAAAAAKDEAKRNSAFLLDFIGKNVTFAQIAELLSMKGKLDEAVASGSLERITLANKETEALLETTDLIGQRSAYFAKNPVKSAAEKEADNLFKAENGLAVTDGNKALLEGAARDVLVLYSKSTSAPNIAVNLLGEVTFVDDKAIGCWAHNSRPEALRLRYLATELGRLGARRVDAGRHCAEVNVAELDLILLERQAFLGEPVDEAQRLINRFIGGELAVLYQLEASAFDQIRSGSGENAELITSDVKAGARSGFGFIATENGSSEICAVVGARGDAHQLVLDSLSEDLLYLLNGPNQLKGTNLESAFIDLQKARCGTLYASAADMKLVLTALERQSIDHTVIPLWITDQQVADADESLRNAANAEAALAAQKRKEFLRRQAELAQLEEGRAALEEKQRRERQAENAAKQAKLRQQNEKPASLAFRELEKIIATHIAAEPVGSQKQSSLEVTKQKFANLFPSAASWFVSDAQADEETRRILERANFRELFPKTSRWVRNGKYNGWEMESVDIEMTDFGRAVWKERWLETVFADTTVRIKNRELGEFRTYCFQAGMMIDNDFDYIRSPVEGSCEEDDLKTQSWKIGNRFESFWIVE